MTEELSLQCAMYVVQDREDESLYLVGSEQGGDKVALAERDIVYLNKGSNAGVKAGDLYTLHHVAYPVRHPVSGKKLGTKIETTGWVKVILVQEDTACAVIEQSCLDIHAGDYLKPFEKVNVPMVVRRAAGRVLRAGQRQDRPPRRRPPGRRDHRRRGPVRHHRRGHRRRGRARQRVLGLPHHLPLGAHPPRRRGRGDGGRGARADGDRQGHLLARRGHGRRRGRAALGGVWGAIPGLGGGAPRVF